MTKKDYSLVYISDAYCGWCYGFSESIYTFYKKHPEIDIEVISGGLFVGDHSLPINQYPHIAQANERIAQMTGAVFGKKYQELLKNGTFVLDSQDAAVGMAALKAVDNTRSVEYIHAMQEAFYKDAKSLSEDNTFIEIAKNLGLDTNLVQENLNDEASLKSAYNDFLNTQKLGVEGFPTLLFKQEDKYMYLGGANLTPQDIELKINQILAQNN